LLIIELSDIATEKIEFALRKKMPTREDLNPNRRFADNPLAELLRNNRQLKNYVSTKKVSWSNYPDVLRKIYTTMTAWPPYIEYMKAEKNSFSADKKFITRLITEFFVISEDLQSCFEEQSIFWNDDLDYVAAMVEKTLRKFKNDGNPDTELMPLYKNEDDVHYVKTLLRKTIIKSKEYSELIDKNTTNWEVERIALMDILVMQLAITEIVEFQEIPVKVTLNEYIEIAKYYCTSKSSTFVNGILDKVVREMKENDMFRKTGRGLVGDVVTEDE
jgi:N utilization substance protein B